MLLPTKTKPSIREDLVAFDNPAVGLICKPRAEIDGDVVLARLAQSTLEFGSDTVAEACLTGRVEPY